MSEGKGNAYRISVGKPEGKRPLGSSGHRWEDSTKTDLKETGWETCTGLIWLRTGTKKAKSCERGNRLSDSIKCGEFRD
jgi:hypothetical protein